MVRARRLESKTVQKQKLKVRWYISIVNKVDAYQHNERIEIVTVTVSNAVSVALVDIVTLCFSMCTCQGASYLPRLSTLANAMLGGS